MPKNDLLGTTESFGKGFSTKNVLDLVLCKSVKNQSDLIGFNPSPERDWKRLGQYDSKQLIVYLESFNYQEG